MKKEGWRRNGRAEGGGMEKGEEEKKGRKKRWKKGRRKKGEEDEEEGEETRGTSHRHLFEEYSPVAPLNSFEHTKTVIFTLISSPGTSSQALRVLLFLGWSWLCRQHLWNGDPETTLSFGCGPTLKEATPARRQNYQFL